MLRYMLAPFLIADDSAQKMMILQGLLHRAGWEGEVLTAATTEEAKEKIDAHPEIGYAFIDYYMPTENGPSVIHYLKEKNPSARIALVSSADNADNAREAKEAGAEAVICTSYPADEVESAVLGIVEEWSGT